jgi:hypothetical protein
VIVQLQVLSEGVGKLWGENVIWTLIQIDDIKHNDKKIAFESLDIASFMSCFTDRNVFNKWFSVKM